MNSPSSDNGGSFDVQGSRAIRNYSSREMIARVMWRLAQPAFFLSPRILYRWRNFLLRMFGASVGSGVRIHQTSHIRYPWLFSIDDNSAIGENAIVYNLGQVTIGKRATISQNAHLCAGTHDYNDTKFPLVRSTIKVGDDCWVCADAFVGPNVILGDHSIAAARAVVVKDIPANEIFGGNPAKKIISRNIATTSGRTNGNS